jgi:chitinase
MGTMIKHAQFDILYIQFYNTPSCSARNWISGNPDPNSPFIPFVEKSTGFSASYGAWTEFLVGSASKNAKIYIGLPGSKQAVWDGSFALGDYEARRLLKSYFCKANFGGVVIWEATYADSNIEKGLPFYRNIKNGLTAFSNDKNSGCCGN